MKDVLRKGLRALRLSGMAATIEVRAQEAMANNLTPLEFLELAVQDELLVREQRLIERRRNMAGFREQKRLDEFDFGFNPSIKRNVVFELATCQFIRERKDVLLVGPPGVGKSHVSQAIG